MRVMRAIYSDKHNRLHKGHHSHICNGGLPLCKLSKRQFLGHQDFKEWAYEDSDSPTCPACNRIASRQGAGGAA